MSRAVKTPAGFDPAALRYGADGLIPVVVQEVASGALLMLAWADRDAVERTLESGQACFWSRSRQAPWRKGETSGNTLAVSEVRVDCDGDALLLRADPSGPTCHRQTWSCFDPPGEGTDGPADQPARPPSLELGWLSAVIAGRRDAGGAESYTSRLLAAGAERIARKVGEEATEVVIAALGAAREATPDRRRELAEESADLLYHLLVLLESCAVSPHRVARTLRTRHVEDASPPAAKPEAGR